MAARREEQKDVVSSQEWCSARLNYCGEKKHQSSLPFMPLILLADLFLLLGSEVVFDVEGLSALLGGFPLDHVSHCLACDIQQTWRNGGREEKESYNELLRALKE